MGESTGGGQGNGMVAAGRADLVAIGRPPLSGPHWTRHAAAQLGYNGVQWARQYQRGKVQLERIRDSGLVTRYSGISQPPTTTPDPRSPIPDSR